MGTVPFGGTWDGTELTVFAVFGLFELTVFTELVVLGAAEEVFEVFEVCCGDTPEPRPDAEFPC
jgi:hypothetical protein